MLRVLDLFSGIGGFSRGLERTGGFETAAFCEYAEWPRKVLAKHWPNVPIFEDVRTLKGSDIDGPIDVICGGYPCQPFSMAGRRKGQEDDRHLWPEFNRLVAELRPTWVIGENVAGHISMGLDDVLSDLEGQGYACRTFVIPACATDAPHRRDRVWTVANASGRRSCESRQREDEQQGRTKAVGGSENLAHAPQLQRDGGRENPEQSKRQVPQSGTRSGTQHVADADSKREPAMRRERSYFTGEGAGRGNDGRGSRTDAKREVSDGGAEQNSSHVAHAADPRLSDGQPPEQPKDEAKSGTGVVTKPKRRRQNVAHAIGIGQSGQGEHEQPSNRQTQGEGKADNVKPERQSRKRRTEPGMGGMVDGLPAGMDRPCRWPDEPDIPRVAKGVKDRANRLKALGNAVVPQIPEMIGRAILQAEAN